MSFKRTVFRISRARCAQAVVPLVACFVLLAPIRAHAANLQWAGREWKVTSGGMAGVADGSPSNVSVDASGYLHLKITNNSGTWTAAEIFTTDKLGFGTYQWQVDAPIDRFDKNVVLGLFPYGPDAGIGADGTNEIDIEYSFWGDANGVNGDWTDYPNSGKTIGEKSYKFSLSGGTFSTSRFIWGASSIQNFLLIGFQTVGSTTGLLNSWTYSPASPSTNIPQQAMPLGINLWCFDNPPSDGKNVEVVIRDFEFVPEGSSGAGGAGGASAGGASAGGASAGGIGGANAAGANSGGAGGTAHAGAGGMTGGAPGSAGSGAGGSSSGGGSSAGGTSAGGSTSAAAGSLNVGGGSTGGAANTSTPPSDASDSGGCNVSASKRPRRSFLYFVLPSALLVLGRRLRRGRRLSA